MVHFCWDASALGKRYSPEQGTAVVNHLFLAASAGTMRALLMGVGEVLSIIIRRRNSGVLSPTVSAQALSQWRAELIHSPLFQLETATDLLIHRSFPLLIQHSLNATDAVVLRSALDLARIVGADGDDLVLIASDARLLSAAQSEGLMTFDPATGSVTTLNQWLTPSTP